MFGPMKNPPKPTRSGMKKGGAATKKGRAMKTKGKDARGRAMKGY